MPQRWSTSVSRLLPTAPHPLSGRPGAGATSGITPSTMLWLLSHFGARGSPGSELSHPDLDPGRLVWLAGNGKVVKGSARQRESALFFGSGYGNGDAGKIHGDGYSARRCSAVAKLPVVIPPPCHDGAVGLEGQTVGFIPCRSRVRLQERSPERHTHARRRAVRSRHERYVLRSSRQKLKSQAVRVPGRADVAQPNRRRIRAGLEVVQSGHGQGVAGLVTWLQIEVHRQALAAHHLEGLRSAAGPLDHRVEDDALEGRVAVRRGVIGAAAGRQQSGAQGQQRAGGEDQGVGHTDSWARQRHSGAEAHQRGGSSLGRRFSACPVEPCWGRLRSLVACLIHRISPYKKVWCSFSRCRLMITFDFCLSRSPETTPALEQFSELRHRNSKTTSASAARPLARSA
ncbi:hypothetical protein BOO71_0011374 [Deinococcus marmoris]|uniref:Uncharacterized protein n=1 Tax=Deinococcus marmoris TaxID=249408 RepID=A0A1U7NUK3_9DEIO|nr:hypothetical protein BOO71_0011374 [Deinococcus marmoris]